MPTQLAGKPVAEAIRSDVTETVASWVNRSIMPKMVTLLVGDDKASEVYATQKARWAEKLGILFEIHRLPATATQGEVEDSVVHLSNDPSIHGIMVEMPLPQGLDTQAIVSRIHELKDVDGLSPCHSFARSSPDAALYPATPLACIRILKHYGYTLKGANVTLVGCGRTVGLPLFHLLIAEGATVTACHEFTKDVEHHLAHSEIVCVAVGLPGLITKHMVHEGLTVVDVGITQAKDGSVLGDLAADAAPNTQAYTPTPGGVGAVTTLQIFANLMHAMDLQHQANLL